MVPIIWNMQIYCLKCKKHTDNIGSKKVTMTVTNKVIRNKSKCAVWMLVWVITMLQSNRIDISKRIDINKTVASKVYDLSFFINFNSAVVMVAIIY